MADLTSSGGGSGVTVGVGQSLTEPYAPGYLGDAASTVQQLLTSASASADAQKQRLMDYIGHLYQLRNLATQAARGAGARGASGQQNPLSVYRAMNEMASQAGIPMDAEISKALQQGDSIENTLNGLISNAAQIYTQLGSVQKSQSQSYAPGGGSVASIGGSGKGNNAGMEGWIDIQGNPHKMGDTGINTGSGFMASRGAESNSPRQPYQESDYGNQYNPYANQSNLSGSMSGWTNPYSGQGTNYLPGFSSFGINPDSFGFGSSGGFTQSANPDSSFGGGSSYDPFGGSFQQSLGSQPDSFSGPAPSYSSDFSGGGGGDWWS